jgi:coenzyme F420-reducing hydrogenase delta subunit
MRVHTVARLLSEIGLEPGRVELIHISPNDPADRLEPLVRDAVKRVSAFGAVTLHAEDKKSEHAAKPAAIS